jgi:hypothetical protein
MVESSAGAVAMRVTAPKTGGFEIWTLYQKMWDSDIVICGNPMVVTDMRTFKQLDTASIDFDYPSGEFVITREPRVVSA